MTIKLEVELVEEVVGITFSTKEERDAFMRQYNRRLEEKAKEKGIKDMHEVKRGYQDEITEELMQEYLELARAYQKTGKKDATANDILIVD